MTETLGDRIRANRERRRSFAEIARQAAQDWAKEYTDNAKALIQTYVDNQITQALLTAKNYVDGQLAQSKTYVDTKDAELGARIDSLIAHNGLLP